MFVLKRDDSYLLSVNAKNMVFGELSSKVCKWKKAETISSVLTRISSWGHNIDNVNIVDVEIPGVSNEVKIPKEKKVNHYNKPSLQEKHEKILKRKNMVEREYSIKVECTSKVITISIPQCPSFRFAFRSWDENPTYFKWITMSNYDTIQYKNHNITERVGGCVEFSESLTIPGDYWGENVPNELRDIIKTVVNSLIKEIKEDSWSTGFNKLMVFPLNSFSKLKEELENKTFKCAIKKHKIRNEDFKISIEEDESTNKEEDL